MFRYSIFACCLSFLICDSNLSSHPGFNFLSVVFRGTLSFSLTNFASANIKSFKSVMLFVGVFVHKSFTFSVSDLTIPQSWFLRESNEVLFSDIVLFIISSFIFSSWVSVCVFVFEVHRSISLSVWLWLRISNFPVFSVSITVLICLPIYLLVDFQYFNVR